MSHSELLGVSDGFALFGDNKGLTVVVNLSNLDVFDPVPQVSVEFSRWGEADPAQVPTEAFELADSALGSATRVEGTDVLIASGVADRRSFAIPRAAQEEASRALARSTASQEADTAISRNMAKTLASGVPVGIAKVRHIARFFAHSDGASAMTLSLWGGETANKWAANIVKREQDLAVLAGLDFEPTAPEPEEPVDGEDTYETAEPHAYTPDAAHGYACETCGNDEDAALHTLFPEEEEPEPVAASAARPVVTYDDFTPGVPEPDMYISVDVNGDGVPDQVTGIHLRGADDVWKTWSPGTHSWEDAPEQSDVEPIDEDSAYATALMFDNEGTDAVPARDIDPAEWDIADAARSDLDQYTPEAMDDVSFSVTVDPDSSAVRQVLLHALSGEVWAWDAGGVEWAELSVSPDELAIVDAAQAREMAMRLTASQYEESDIMSRFESAFSRAAWINLADGDGVYSPEERSVNAQRQVRDSMGRFTKAGAVVHVNGSNRTGQVVSVDPEKNTVRVRYSDGKVQELPVSEIVRIGQGTAATGKGERRIFTRDDVTRVARSDDLTAKAVLPAKLPVKSAEDIALMLRDYDAYIKKVRAQESGLQPVFAALDPETTDVPPLYLAQVDELDNTAVVDLFALVPKSKTVSEVILYTRKDGGWMRDDKMLSKLKSTSPPPIVTLDAATYKTVVEQVDSYYKEKGAEAAPAPAPVPPVVASLALPVRAELWDEYGALVPVFEAQSLVAGGVPGVADTPGDVRAARKLRNYWLRGRGAAKIRWNTPGDWTRCVRHLSKYMGTRSKGYCQNLHKDATGLYTGDSLHRKLYGRHMSSPTVVLSSVDDISADTTFPVLLAVDIPSVKDLSLLSTRTSGHELTVGERFLVNGGDGVYTVEVLDPTSITGWESESAVLVAGEGHAMLLQEASA